MRRVLLGFNPVRTGGACGGSPSGDTTRDSYSCTMASGSATERVCVLCRSACSAGVPMLPDSSSRLCERIVFDCSSVYDGSLSTPFRAGTAASVRSESLLLYIWMASPATPSSIYGMKALLS